MKEDIDKIVDVVLHQHEAGEKKKRNSNPIRFGLSIGICAMFVTVVLLWMFPTAVAPGPEGIWNFWSNKPDMFNTNTGNVGIGTSTPVAKLDIYGNFAINGAVIIDSSGHWVGDPTGLIGPQGPQGEQGPPGPQSDYLSFPPITQPNTPTEGFIIFCDSADGKLKTLDMYGETTILAEPQQPPEPSEWIYVDDDGGKDFTSIQAAIDYSDDGDTIYVYSGNYNEQVIIDKSIDLIGENKESTYVGRILLGNYLTEYRGNNINVSGFHLGKYYVEHNYIYIYADNSKVTNCIIEEIDTSCPASHGVALMGDNIDFSNNIVRNIQYQGLFGFPRNSDIYNNQIYNIGCNGMHWEGDGYDNLIHDNVFSNCGMWAIRMKATMHNNDICFNNFGGDGYSDESYGNYWHDNIG
ncbi:MAG: hypothetical protein JW840_08940 [Candidatus Thermoplasmatota archaeon]|nr:hypothetical protein [Candidatus Thermoplasmatota archaeon]